MASDFSKLPSIMNGYAVKLVGGVEALVKKIAGSVTKQIIETTPVDTALARSNWIVSLGGAFDSTIPPHAPGRHLGIGESTNARAAIADADTVLAGYRQGQLIYIQNNVDYIGILNSPETPSRQAPPFFIQLAVKAGIEETIQSSIL